MKVLVTLNIPEAGLHMLEEAGHTVTVHKEVAPMSQEELIERCQEVDALLCTGPDKIDRHFLESCRHLQAISIFAAGYDNIDVASAKEMGVPVGNAPDAMSDATADVAFMLMLAASRKLCYMHKSIIAGDWGYFEPRAHLGQELKGKTLGIFGLGRIGMEMARRCKGAYQMEVIYHNRRANRSAEQELGARAVSFEELLKQSDVLSVHSVLSEETKGQFDKAAFSQMKPNAIFVNTSRGPVHNETDLIEALENGTIWGAGLDVTNPEPMAPDNPLLSMENVAVAPHIGSATVEARDEMSRRAAQNIIQFFEEGKVAYPIT